MEKRVETQIGGGQAGTSSGKGTAFGMEDPRLTVQTYVCLLRRKPHWVKWDLFQDV